LFWFLGNEILYLILLSSQGMILFIWCVSLPCVYTHTPWTIWKNLCLCRCVVLGLHLRESYICMLVLSLHFPQPSPLPPPNFCQGFSSLSVFSSLYTWVVQLFKFWVVLCVLPPAPLTSSFNIQKLIPMCKLVLT
jgi:hypothetical protein